MSKYKILEQQGLNYLTLTIVGWVSSPEHYVYTVAQVIIFYNAAF